MAKIISCDNCDKNVIVNGEQAALYYEYDVLPFFVEGTNLSHSNERATVCASCDEKLRRQNGLPARGARGRLA